MRTQHNASLASARAERAKNRAIVRGLALKAIGDLFHRGWLSAIAFVVVVLLVGCSQPLTTRQKSAGVGALLGGATGALVGAAVGSPGVGAAIGTALGAGTGALVGDRLQQRDTEVTQQEEQIQRQSQDLARNRQLLEELKRQGLEAEETSRGVVVNLPDVLFQFGQAGLNAPSPRPGGRYFDDLEDSGPGSAGVGGGTYRFGRQRGRESAFIHAAGR